MGGHGREALQAQVFLEWIMRSRYTLHVSIIKGAFTYRGPFGPF